jgi:FkbH-like protein
MLPRYDIRNPVFFIESLNQLLDERVRAHAGCHILDVDQIAASLGKKYVQDDAVWQINHASALADGDFEHDQARIEPVQKVSEVYQLKVFEFVQAAWHEALAMYRTIGKIDTVKLVIVDLDDTLWRGIFAEGSLGPIEGWPLGIAEALLFVKNRGVILAIASKNDPALIEKNFKAIFGAHRLRFEDFAIRKINWLPKAENIGEIIREANVLPNSVVFIDDNPTERAAIKATFPAIRVIGGDLYSTRRILLWAAETQVPEITDESSRRSEMIAAQIEREESRGQLSREAFLASLDLTVGGTEIFGASGPNFARALELLNKSNQFNTTGKRWSHQEWLADASAGLRMFAFHVSDKYTDYGIVVVALISGNTIFQLVMSCRVFGLGVEEAVLSDLNRRMIADGARTVCGVYQETKHNQLCSDLYARLGFQRVNAAWEKPSEPCVAWPPHIGTPKVET